MNSLYENLVINSPVNNENVIISDNKYRVRVCLFNSSGKIAKINYSAIQELKIIDDVNSFYAEGYLTFDNSLDALESFQSAGYGIDGTVQNTFIPFQFRNDGRDFLYINFEPQLQADDLNVLNNPKNLPQPGLTYIFAIYDMEDIIFEDKTVKHKKLYFYDYMFQFLREKNAFFSTGKVKHGISNEDRSIYTGEAIQRLIADVSTYYNVPYNFGDWDKGAGKIFYSSPANYKAIDDLYYLLDYHVSEAGNEYSPVILRKQDETWSLTPISKIFQQSYFKGLPGQGDLGGIRLRENFILGKQNAGEEGILNTKSRNPTFSPFAARLTDYPLIENFQVSNMAATDASNSIISHMVHSYNFSNKQFTIDIENNNIEKNTSVYNKLFVQTQKGNVGSLPSSNISLNQTRIKQQNIINKYNPHPDPNVRLNSGRNRFLMSGIFLNTTISFRARGNVVRDAGNFITINRYDSQTPSEFDNKMLGTYFVTKVEHVFKNGTYNNNMVAVKTYNYDKSSNINRSSVI